MGDLSAKVGRNNAIIERVMGREFKGLGEANENGKKLVDFCTLNNLTIGGTLFETNRFAKQRGCHEME